MRRFGLRVAFRTVVDVLVDGARLGCLTLHSRTHLAAENLFLRKQLGLYLERQVKPTPRNRRDSHHTGRVVAIGRLASVAGDRQAGHADSLASNGVSVVLAVAITGTGTSTHSSRPAAADRADGDGDRTWGGGRIGAWIGVT